MRVRNARQPGRRIELQMTSMIDIVFLLLVFFVMTFNVVIPEGDFNIRMPASAPGEQSNFEPQVVLPVRLIADAGGDLAGIRLGDVSLGSLADLRHEVRRQLGGDATGGLTEQTEVEIDADANLRYEYVIQAITHVSGYVNPQGKVVQLVEKIKFSPPERAQ